MGVNFIEMILRSVCCFGLSGHFCVPFRFCPSGCGRVLRAPLPVLKNSRRNRFCHSICKMHQNSSKGDPPAFRGGRLPLALPFFLPPCPAAQGRFRPFPAETESFYSYHYSNRVFELQDFFAEFAEAYCGTRYRVSAIGKQTAKRQPVPAKIQDFPVRNRSRKHVGHITSSAV